MLEATREEQLKRQLLLIDQIKERLMLQAAQAADTRYWELSAGRWQVQQQMAPTQDLLASTWAGTYCPRASPGTGCLKKEGGCSGEVLCSSTPEGKCGGLKYQLQALQQEDARCIVTTRRLAKLGFDSAHKVRCYFSCYGEVQCVHVPGSTRQESTTPTPKRRAGSVGFVVMASAEAACAVVQDGPAHVVCGVMITVHAFEDDAASARLNTQTQP